MSCSVVLLRPLLLEQRLGPPIVLLLLPICFYGISAVMPDNSGRAESNSTPFVEKTPAHVNIVSGNPVSRIEPADCSKTLPMYREIATWNVLGFRVSQHHVQRTTWRITD